VKTCTKCGQTKPPEAFHKSAKYKGGLDCHCRECKKARHVAYYAANRGAVLARNRGWALKNKARAAECNRNAAYMRTHGITSAQRDAMAESQANRCAICGCPKPKHGGRGQVLHIDHDHVTGKLRGLLCFECNTGLGKFGDSPERLELAATYLREHKQNPS
jgi:hypothetical protein